jgi:hypothetical protein
MSRVIKSILTVAFVTAFVGIAVPSFAQIKITYPTENSRVSGEVVEVTGAGADPNAQLEVSVLTDRWYVQDGRLVVNADGTWTFSPVYLAGRGVFNNHTIRVTIVKNGNRGASTSVRGVVRRE